MPRKTRTAAVRPDVRNGGFNEAAARCRGKQVLQAWAAGVAPASMRPRPDAAENRAPAAGDGSAGRRFNEAAARCRGKPLTTVHPSADNPRLQ